MIPSFIYLYDGARGEINLNEISLYLENIFKKTKIQIRKDLIPSNKIDDLAKEFAKIRIKKRDEPLPSEIEYEKKRISNPKNKSFGILYDGFDLMSLYSKMLSKEESNLNHCHIVFTNQLFATKDEGDRYHLRVSIYGFPSIISTSGIVEAPAKPREFYLKKQLGFDVYALKKEFKDRFIDYDDERLTEVLKGYVLQAIFYQIIKDPFCEDNNCRLYNAHWQEEVLQAQLKNKFCKRHQEIIDSI